MGAGRAEDGRSRRERTGRTSSSSCWTASGRPTSRAVGTRSARCRSSTRSDGSRWTIRRPPAWPTGRSPPMRACSPGSIRGNTGSTRRGSSSSTPKGSRSARSSRAPVTLQCRSPPTVSSPRVSGWSTGSTGAPGGSRSSTDSARELDRPRTGSRGRARRIVERTVRNRLGSLSYWAAVWLARFPGTWDYGTDLAMHVRHPSDGVRPRLANWLEPTAHQWLQDSPADKPVYCFVNLLDAHEPYLAEPEVIRSARSWWWYCPDAAGPARLGPRGLEAEPPRARAAPRTLPRDGPIARPAH